MTQRINKWTVRHYVTDLTPAIREYLTGVRGLTPPVIWNAQLGWNGRRITIPIFNRRGQPVFFKLARAPGDAPDVPKMICWPAGHDAELYGWEHLQPPLPDYLVVCEGEFDRLVLESRGIPAVTGTAGGGVFLPEWAKALSPISTLFVCYDRDDAGIHGAEKVARLLPHAKIVTLPEAVGSGGDITDFFVRLGGSVGEFRQLLRRAEPLPVTPRSIAIERDDATDRPLPIDEPRDPRIAAIKTHVPLELIVRGYIPDLKLSGKILIGRCIFHCDDHPSFVLYPEQDRFHCYGCGTHGDVIQFVMEAECVSFPQALLVLENFLARLL